jgi:hypothetical protein
MAKSALPRAFLWALPALVCAAVPSPGAVPSVPDFSGFWQHGVAEMTYARPESGPGPIGRTGVPEGYPVNDHWRGDYNSPLLQPWAAQALKKAAERDEAGLPENTGQATCRPAGVPAALTYLRPIQILQTAKAVTILYQYDHQSRSIALGRAHSAGLAPSWFGDSIGHYEGDTLVVDTVGLNDKTWTDHLGTPHTEALHVVERYRVVEGGKALSVAFTLDDPGAFTAPWSGSVTYQRVNIAGIDEEVCAENNRGIPVPVADIDPISGEKLK